MIKRLLAIIALATALSGCGSGAGKQSGDDETSDPGVSSLTLSTDTPQIPSDGSTDATITAYVRSATNQFMEDVAVTFSANSGGLSIVRGTTDTTGTAVAELVPAGDPTNRTITVTATAGSVTSTITIDVTGTQLTISGPANLAQNAVGSYSVSLRDSAGVGISGRSVAISSARSNTLSAASVTTNASGLATFTVTAVNGGDDTITAQALGLTATQSTAVSVDQFTFTTPAENAEITLNTPQTVSVQWLQAGVAQVGRNVAFSTTRGTVSGGNGPNVQTGVTDSSGVATVSVAADNAGLSVITAVGEDGPTTTRTVEFVATTPDSIDVQASPSNIAPEGQSVITAVVRDIDGNRVKNQVVSFTLTDVTGGQLSVAQATTDSQGRAQTTYTASSSTSANNGVQVEGRVQGTTITDTALITVAQRQVFISLGTGNEIAEPNTAEYSIEYSVSVTDANGAGVANTSVTLSILSIAYRTGSSTFSGGSWVRSPITATCEDEDENHNGLLDTGEDDNSSNAIEAGNIARVSAGTVTTDSTGRALFNVIYPQEYAYWVKTRLAATTLVQGTESTRSLEFILPGIASDFSSQNTAPPGQDSPFNPVGTTCAATTF